MTESEYLEHDGLELARLVRHGETTPAELAETAIARIERLDPSLNAVVHRLFDEGLAEAARVPRDAPFVGVPFLLKDLLSLYAGAPTTSGSRMLRDWVPDHDSEVVRRFRAAGLVTLGKTNTPELGLPPYTEPELFGPTRNPWDPARSPGGSSGGSAAAVAAGMVPLAGGGDGGGSIRIPASCCGIFGLKPSRGRVPTGPDQGEVWRGAAVEHVLTRSVRDSAAALDAVAGPDAGAPYVAPTPERPFLRETELSPGRLRVAFTWKPLLGSSVHPECRRAVEDAAALLESLGHHVEEGAPEVDREAFSTAFLTMVCAELRADLDDAERITGRRAGPRWLEPATWALALVGRSMSAGRYAGAVRYLQRASRRVAPFFERHDVLVTPTVASPPPRTGALQPQGLEAAALRLVSAWNGGWALERAGLLQQVARRVFDFAAYTPVFNVTGQPAMSVPLHWTAEGLPVGVQLVSRFGEEGLLFRLGRQLEEARPWFHRRPGGFA